MNCFRPLTLAAATLLFIPACSSPDDLTAPTLEPQFGSADNDRPVDVTFVSTGRIYSLSDQRGPLYADNGGGTSHEDGFYEKALLRRYDSSGKLTWTKELLDNSCTYNWWGEEACTSYSTRTLEADSQGNIYAMFSYEYSAGDCVNGFGTYVEKYDASGNYRNGFQLGGNGGNFGESFDTSVAMTVDASGNVYAGLQQASVDSEECTSANRRNVVSKYSTNGSLLWQRTSAVGVPTDITVSSSGSVYVVGNEGLARYSSSGGLTWTKTGNFAEVIISGSNLYTRYLKDVRKYDGNGKQLWLKTQSGLKTMVFQDIDGDGSGNVYLSGKYEASTGNMNAMVRKLNSSGSVLWTKTYGTSSYDDAKGIATITGSEIYTTGLTKGSLAHANIGGEDGYLRKLSSSGNPLWTH